jgi:hypothetical protein
MTKRKEIDILVEAARKQCAVVEKASHVLWTPEELAEARAAGLYQAESRLLSPDRQAAISGPYPGCCQQAGGLVGTASYRAVGQTEHFLIFVSTGGGPGPTPEGEGQ